MALADLFRMLADRLLQFGKDLIELANGSAVAEMGKSHEPAIS